MRVLLAILLVSAALAGCAAEDQPVKDEVEEAVAVLKGGPMSHPAYGYLVNDDLRVGNASDFPAPGAWSASDPPGNGAWVKPAHRGLPEVPRELSFSARSQGVSGGAGIAVFGPLVIAGPTSGPLHVINIIEPEAPVHIGTVDAPVRDADTILYPDGRLVVVTTAGRGQMFFTDITDPYNPEVVGQISTPNINHNLAVIPGTPIVYNSPSSGTETDIVDASDPANPILVKSWESDGCHDMTFYINATQDKYRAYCAGLGEVGIWDITDPLDPEVLNSWGWPALGQHDTGSIPLVTFAHLAIPNHDASILILGDETGGGAAPGCDFSAHAAGTTVSGPFGNLWFYDITDEMNPVLKGSVSPSAHEQRGSCTAHFGRVLEDTNHVVMGFYSAGVTLVDFRDPQNPVIVDRYTQPTVPVASEGQGAGNIWDVWYHQGYVITGDTRNGVDVLLVD